MNITLSVSLLHPQHHYINVSYRIKRDETGPLVLVFPVWSPGSYLVREYQGNVEDFRVTTSLDKKITFEKISKNRWRLFAGEAKDILITYRVYTSELNVRSCYVDHRFGFFNPTSVFFYPEGELNNPVKLKVTLPPRWKIAVTGTTKTEILFKDFDHLYDTPVLAGSSLVFEKFTVGSTRYRMAFFGDHFSNTKRMAQDVKAIVTEQKKIFGKNPCRDYLFQVLFVKGKYGGLEHAHSSTNLFDGLSLDDPKRYREFLSLLSHEHFHLWNVKRIRPLELGPFDYEAENYTQDLWLAEGFTSYYDDLCVLRAGKMTQKDYWDVLSQNIKKFENQKSKSTNSLTDSSFDSWIRFYRPTENSPNTVMSYYLKGSLVALWLNLLILKSTQGRKSLDDVMRKLFERYQQNPQLGITRNEFLSLLKKTAPLNVQAFEKDYLTGTKSIVWKEWATFFGLTWEPNKKQAPYYLGINLEKRNGRIFIRFVAEDSPAYHSALRAGDELLAINGERIEDEKQLDPYLKKKSAILLFSRFGKIGETQVNLAPNKNFDSKLIVSPRQSKAQKKFLRTWLKAPRVQSKD